MSFRLFCRFPTIGRLASRFSNCATRSENCSEICPIYKINSARVPVPSRTFPAGNIPAVEIASLSLAENFRWWAEISFRRGNTGFVLPKTFRGNKCRPSWQSDSEVLLSPLRTGGDFAEERICASWQLDGALTYILIFSECILTQPAILGLLFRACIAIGFIVLWAVFFFLSIVPLVSCCFTTTVLVSDNFSCYTGRFYITT